MPTHLPTLLNDYVELIDGDDNKPSMCLVDLGVTAEMCASYVQYRRDLKNGLWTFQSDPKEVSGTVEAGASDFLRLTGAPQILTLEFRTGQVKAQMKREISMWIASFGFVGYTQHTDTLRYFRKWGKDDSENPVQPVEIGGGVVAYLHFEKKEIDALRQRILQKIMNEYNLGQRLMVKDILSVLRLPLYNIFIIKS